MAIHQASRFARHFGFWLLVLGLVGPAQKALALDSDDDMPITRTPVGGSATPNNNGQPPAPVLPDLRIGVLDMRPNFEAERAIPENVRGKLASDLLQTMDEINTRPKALIPSQSVLKNLGPRERVLYDSCWVDPDCLASALVASNLDTVLVGKLRFKQLDLPAPTGPNNSLFAPQASKVIVGEYSLLVRLIDLRQRRILREFVVTNPDHTRLSELAISELRKHLVALGLIGNGLGAPLSNTAASESLDTPLNLDTEALKALARPGTNRAKYLKAAGWTTLTVGLLTGGLGGVFGLTAKKKEKDQKTTDNPGALPNLRSQRKKYTLAANALYGTGGGLLLTSIVLLSVGYTDHGDAGSAGGVFVSGDGVFFSAQTRF